MGLIACISFFKMKAVGFPRTDLKRVNSKIDMMNIRKSLEDASTELGCPIELKEVILALGAAAVEIRDNLSVASLRGLLGIAHSCSATPSNPQRDIQKKIDVVANEIILEMMTKTNKVHTVFTEECDDPVFIMDRACANYALACDPLDGSSNIDCAGKYQAQVPM